MILFPAYIAAIWIPAFVFRRRPLGFIVAIFGPIPIMLIAWLVSALMPSAGLMTSPWWLTLYTYIALSIGAGGVVIACAPRRAKAHECAECHYDLRGNVTGVCPECGRVYNAALLNDAQVASAITEDVIPDAPASDGRADPRAA